MEQIQVDRPRETGRGILLLYMALGIGGLRLIMEASRLSQHPSIGTAILTSVTVLGIIWFFIHMIGTGKNWARITFLVFFIIGLPFEVQALQQALAANPVSALLGIAQTLI